MKKKQVLWMLLLVALLWRAAFFCVSVNRVHVSGDECIMALQARGMTQSAEDPAFQTKQRPRGVFGRFPLLFMAQPYLFPVESYLSAPFIRLLPATALGLRLVPSIMGLFSSLFGLLLLRRWAGEDARVDGLPAAFPAAAWLVVFPSAYVLMLQCVYMLPSYPAFMLLGLAALWAAERNRAETGWNPGWALLTGFLAGLAGSSTLLALPLAGALGVMTAVGRSPRKALVGLPSFALGLAVGLGPYFLAKAWYPGAHAAVSATVSFPEALERLWNPALKFTLPTALGFVGTLMPDAVEMVRGFLPESLLPVVAVGWLIFMAAVSVCCVVSFFRRAVRARWPDISGLDVITGLSWVYVLLFVMTTRFGSHEFRYLLPVALFFPLVLGGVLRGRTTAGRRVTGFAVAALLLVNITTSLALARTWLSDSFNGYFTDTRPAIEALREKGIRHAYSSYFDAYTINFLTDEEILCAQPFNERFFGWPYPYADLVDRATNVAYVLGPGRRFRWMDFESDMERSGLTYQVQTCGVCRVYTDFQGGPEKRGHALSPDVVRVSVSHYPADQDSLSDGVLTHYWRSHQAQEAGMWIQLDLPRPAELECLRFYYNEYPFDYADALNILIRRKDGVWTPVATNVPIDMAAFDVVNGHPVYGWQVQDIPLTGAEADAIRIEIARPRAGRDWTIGELEVYERPRSAAH
ncbi:MAG: hypothetical protein PHP44_02095 [Kiritimatiellae bacterium]|nr:hypothetical protein [Kiritimatiellia bacterium]